MMLYITASHPEARFYEVRDGENNQIWNCTKADVIGGEVTVMIKQGDELLIDADYNPVTVTYKPPGGVQIIDIRGQKQ